MSYAKRHLGGKGVLSLVSGMFAALLIVAIGASSDLAFAQDAQQSAGGKASKQAPAEAKKQAPSTWVKICNQPKEGQPKGCITRSDIIEHEVMQVYGIVGIETVEGRTEKSLIATLPYAVITPRKVKNPKTNEEVTIPATLQFTWSTSSDVKAKIDDGGDLSLKMLYCYRVGCVASVKIGDDVIAKMKSGNNITIIGKTFGRGEGGGRTIPLPVSLNGFTKAIDGEPVDNKKYETFWGREIARRKLAQLDMQNKMIKEMQEKQKAAKAKAEKEGGAAKAPKQ